LSALRRLVRTGGTIARLIFLAGACLLFCAGKPADGIRLEVDTRSGGALHVEGAFDVDASSRTAWEVLTDYERLGEIVPSIKTSRVLSRRGDTVMRVQEALGRVLLFSRRMRVQLEIHEQPMHSIEFRDLLRADFDLYRGDWHIQAGPAGVRIRHEITVRPAFAVPPFILREAFQATAQDQLQQLRHEILRRTRTSAARSSLPR
jgi:hypothetical protein